MTIDYQSVRGLEMRVVDFVQKQLPKGVDAKRSLKELFLDIHTHAMNSLLSKKTYSSKTEFSWSFVRPFLRVGVDNAHMSRTIATLTNLIETITPSPVNAFYMSYDMMAQNGLARDPRAAVLFENIIGFALGNTHTPLQDREILSRHVLKFLTHEPNGLEGKAYARIRLNIMNMARRTLGQDTVLYTGVVLTPPPQQKFVWPRPKAA